MDVGRELARGRLIRERVRIAALERRSRRSGRRPTGAAASATRGPVLVALLRSGSVLGPHHPRGYLVRATDVAAAFASGPPIWPRSLVRFEASGWSGDAVPDDGCDSALWTACR